MPNSDNTHGTFNKQSIIISQPKSGSEVLRIFSSTDDAKSYIFTTNALAVWDECCTNLQWGLVADDNGDNTKLKVTFDFGTKGASDQSAADDWAAQWSSRSTTLTSGNDWYKSSPQSTANPYQTGFAIESSSDHLF